MQANLSSGEKFPQYGYPAINVKFCDESSVLLILTLRRAVPESSRVYDEGGDDEIFWIRKVIVVY